MLYDVHSENIIPGKTLWDSKVLKSASQTTQQPSSNFEIIAEDTIQRKSSSLDIEANLKLSLMGRMVKVSGAARYLDDKKSSEQQARVTLKYSSTTHFQQLTMEQLGVIQYQSVLEDHYATHLVTGIVFGSDAFFVFDRSVRGNEKLQDVHSNMEARIACIPIAIEGSASLDMKEIDKMETEKLHCKFYGDVILPSNPSTFDEAVKVYKELPQLLVNKSVAKYAYLYPLSELDDKPQQIVRWISSDLIAQVEEIMESFHKLEMRANDLMRHSLCSKFADVERQFSTLLILMKRFQMNFSKYLANLLPSIRSSRAEEKELADLIASVHNSPFNSKELTTYLKRKSNREIEQLEQFVKNITKEPKVQCAFPDSDCSLITMITDDEIEYVICFAFNVTIDTSPYIKSLESYLQTGKRKPIAGKEWYDNSDESKALRQKSKQFTQLAQATSSNSENVAFVITDRNEETGSSGPAIIRYTNGVPETFEPPGKPGTPTATNISTDSVDLTWAEPQQGVDFITSYRVFYHFGKDPKIHSIHIKDTERQLHVKDLIPGNEYQFTVQALSDPGVSIESDICRITINKKKRLADMMLKQSRKEKPGNPAIYRLPLNKTGSNPTDGLYKYTVGAPSVVTPKPERVLMVVGATGAGKSTLINGMANYVMGVTWNDTFRFKVVKDEGNRSQAESQTRNITAYTFYSMNLPYNLTVIDTPGFGDTGGIERDKYIAAQIKKFFSGKDRIGIDQLHGIGFVTQASLARLTPTQEYIFGAVLSMFGKDVKDNIFLLITFADANEPPVIAATKAANIPYTESFLFNNSALYATNTSTGPGFNSMFWDMGLVSFSGFFNHFQKATPRSLALTRAVLQEQEQLENLIPGLQQQVKVGLSQLDVIQQEEKILEQHEADIAANKGFKYEVDVEKFNKIPQANTVTTTCLVCNFTCHPSCAYSNDSDKRNCCAMDSRGHCTACPNRCFWNNHANLPFHIEYYTVKEFRTHEDLKQRYESAKSGKEQVKEMVAKKEERLHHLQATVFSLIEQVTESIKRLDEIALKPNPLTEIEYLDLLIKSEQTEAKSGWQRRVAQYQKIRQEAELLKKLPEMTVKDVQSGKSWWKFWKYN
jgi:energy-coupling factor transporter ATP-binding protein EcfA2